MGHRAWFAIERSYALTEGQEDAYQEVPVGVIEEARRRGWSQLWQLSYCQWCALAAHDADESEDFPWDMMESADDLRQVYGPTARSIFAVVDSDEAAWVIPEDPEPELCLWETKLKDYWQYDPNNTPADSEIWKRMPYWVSPDRPDLLGNYVDFWLGNHELYTMMMRMSNAVIQWGFDTPASFARWREASRNSRYREDDDPLRDTPAWWEPIQESSPLRAWWFDFLSRMQSRPEDRATFLTAWVETVVAYQQAAAEAGAPDVAFCSPVPDLRDLKPTPPPHLGHMTINKYALLDPRGSLSEAVDETINLIMREDIIESAD